MVGGGRKLMPGEGYDRSDWKKEEENHTKTFAQSDALSRGSFLKVMLTGAADWRQGKVRWPEDLRRLQRLKQHEVECYCSGGR